MELQSIDVPPPQGDAPWSTDGHPNAVSDADALAMASAALVLFSRWGLMDAEARVLLGGIGQTTLTRWKRGEPGRLGTDAKTRLALLMAIHAELRTLFIETERAYRWIKASNEDFAASRPLDVLLRGQILDLQRVRDYLGALVRGGW